MLPGLLLLIARDLLLHDPPRVLAWRALHDPRLAELSPLLAALLPRPGPELDQDPLALLLAALAVAAAAASASLALLGARPAWRAALLAGAALSLVVLPSLGFMALGAASGRPYGQDGGVVQLPLALDKLLAGESPYGADYSDSILGKEARASDFWAPYGGNPILRHHAYLPGTHLLMLPFYLASRALGTAFDPRAVTLLAYAAAIALAVLLVQGAERRIVAAAVVALNPLAYWHQVFGANDMLVVALLLLAALLALRGRPVGAGLALGLACASKQLAWPFAPFLLAQLSGARGLRDLVSRSSLSRMAAPLAAAAVVFLLVVAPVAALDLGRFWGDIVVYNVGLPGGDNYPLGGTPGFGFANLLIYAGAVSSLRDYVPFGVFYLLLVPLGLLLLRAQLRSGSPGGALVAGSAALLLSLYFSRVVHPNYLVLPALLLPLGALIGGALAADAVVLPLLLLALAVELAQGELLRTTWEQALAVRLPQHLSGLPAALAPRAGPGLTADPLGLALSALAAGLALAWLVASALGARARLRLALAGVAALALLALPALVVARVGTASGVVRGQHPWLGRMAFEAHRQAGRTLGAPPREAWSTSFRRDPPGRLHEGPPLAPGSWTLARGLGALGQLDPRPLVVAALLLAGLAFAARAAPGDRPLAIGLALLAPGLAVGAAFGAPDPLLLALLLSALALAQAGRAAAAGALVGLAVALAPRVLLVAPFVLLAAPVAAGPATLCAGVVALAFSAPGLLALGLPSLWPGGPPAPGVGLPNLFFYRGAEQSAWALQASVWLPAAVAVAAWRLAPRARGRSALAWGGVALLAGLWGGFGVSAHDLALPFASIVLGAGLSDSGALPEEPAR